MSETLRIELLANAAAVAKDLQQVARSMDQVANAQRRLNASGGGAAGGGSGGGRGVGSSGPFTRLYHANNQLGIPNSQTLAQAQHSNLVLAQQRAQSQVNKAMGIGQTGFGQRLNTFIRSTRFGGGGVSPLVGRTMDLFGGGALGGAAGAATGAIAALAVACKQATERLNELAGARNYGGGSITTANRAARIGAVVGMDPSSMGQLSDQVISSIAEGGAATYYARRYGVTARPGMGDQANKMDRTIELIKGIVNDPNEEMARRAAKDLNLQQFLGMRDLSPETREKIFKRMKNGPNEGDVRAAAEFNAQLKLIGDSMKNITVKFARPFLELLAWITDKMSKAVDFVSETWGTSGAMHPPQVAKAIEEAKKREQSAVERNTDALHENTNAVKQAAGMFGGGDRARNAIPKAWASVEFQNRYMKAQAAAMGAFSF